ncbi:MAG TPA: epoxide hydrolase [Thermomicrobiales bacterium]|nr:epoxide hydrolase [Thermomicrobiales bacterium]
MDPFVIAIPDDQLDDLHRRLDNTRFGPEARVSDWSQGMPASTLRILVDHWRHEFNWRAQEARLNRYEQYVADVDGTRIHFVWAKSGNANRVPVILTHGWPYTFAEMLPLADALIGEVDVVVPSLPGFGFSEPLAQPFSDQVVAERWHSLMTHVLGYKRYLTYGEDVGAGISDWLAGLHPEPAAGIVASHASFSARDREGVVLDDEETQFFAWLNDRWRLASAYAAVQGTRPDTLAAALTDSPAGLLAWIGEKLAEWSDGDGYEAFGPDMLLTTASIYWFSGTIGTSFRPYADHVTGQVHPLIEVPASIVVQTHEGEYPRSLAEKSYLDLRSFKKLEVGGHFTAFEAPSRVARAILDLERMVR